MHINSTLGNLINLPVQFLMILVGFIYLKNIKLSTRQLFIAISILFIPSFILYQIVYWAGTIYLFISLMFFFIIYTKKFSSCIYIAILFLIAIITDHMATLLVFNTAIKPANEILQLLLRISIFILFFAVVVIGFKSLRDFSLKKVQISIKVQSLLVLIVFATVLTFYYNIFTVFQDLTIKSLKINLIIFSFYFLFIFILIMFLLSIVYKEQKLQAREKEYQNFENYVSSLEQVNRDMQKFRHDYLNILLSLRGYIQDSDWKGLSKHFEENIVRFEEKSFNSNKIIGLVDNLQIRGLKGLLFTKSNQAIEQNLQISIEIPEPIHTISMDIIDLNRILGILIDNAIEGCMEHQTKHIQVALIQQPKATTIVIRNEVTPLGIPPQKLFEEGFTTKVNGQGIGLSTVRNIISQTSNVSFDLWFNENWFSVELHIMEDK